MSLVIDIILSMIAGGCLLTLFTNFSNKMRGIKGGQCNIVLTLLEFFVGAVSGVWVFMIFSNTTILFIEFFSLLVIGLISVIFNSYRYLKRS